RLDLRGGANQIREPNQSDLPSESAGDHRGAETCLARDDARATRGAIAGGGSVALRGTSLSAHREVLLISTQCAATGVVAGPDPADPWPQQVHGLGPNFPLRPTWPKTGRIGERRHV